MTAAPIEVKPGATSQLRAKKPSLDTIVAGRDILLDTYNLRLKKGSGIKTYGLTLVEGLGHLGASVSLLGDRAASRTRKKGLEEVLFYDHDPKERRGIKAIKGALRGFKRIVRPVASSSIAPQYVVPDQAYRAVPGTKRIYNAHQIYDVANETYKRVGRITKVKLPEKVDIWHATTLLPIRVSGARMVTTIHDVIPLRLPYTTLDDKKFFYNLTRDAIKHSDLIFSVSESTKRDIQLFFDVPDEKIVVTYQSVAFRIYRRKQQLEDAAMRRYGLSRGDYLLFVGNIEPKKNVRAIIEAASELASDIPVVVVGRKGWLWKEQLELAASHFGPDVGHRFRLLDYLPRRDLSALYANATCLVFPSLYEGFGLPPLEAMAHGCPVIVSDVSSLPEVCGDAALYVDPYEPDSIRARIEQLMDDDALRERLVAAGYKRLEKFSPLRYAERLADAYGRIL